MPRASDRSRYPHARRAQHEGVRVRLHRTARRSDVRQVRASNMACAFVEGGGVMAFTRVKIGGWSVGEELKSSQQNQLDINVSNAVDKTGNVINNATITFNT